MLKEKEKEYIEANKDKLNPKRSERITCECGCTSSDKIKKEIKFPNIKNHHVIKNLWKRKIN